MPREIISVHVGQTGCDIGLGFWQMLLKDRDPSFFYSMELSTFFSNEKRTATETTQLQLGDPVSNLRARGIVIDNDAGVLN